MRHVKQLIYGIFYLAIWAGLIGAVYAWQKPAPSCFDNVQNQGETGIDCGGPCVRVCIPMNIAPLGVVGTPQIIFLNTASSSAAHVSLVGEVQNSNATFGAKSFDYVFTLYDDNDTALGSFSGSSFVYPGEIKYVVVPNATLPAGVTPASVQLTMQDPVWSPLIHFSRPQLSIQTASTSIANSNVLTQGTLLNQDSVGFPTVYLTALYYDPLGNIVGVSDTEVANIPPGSSRQFSLFHPIIPNAELTQTQVFATAVNEH